MGLQLNFLISIILIEVQQLGKCHAARSYTGLCGEIQLFQSQNLSFSPNPANNKSYLLKLTVRESQICTDSHTLKINGEKILCSTKRPFCHAFYAEESCRNVAAETECRKTSSNTSFPVYVSYNSNGSKWELIMLYEFIECTSDISKKPTPCTIKSTDGEIVHVTMDISYRIQTSHLSAATMSLPSSTPVSEGGGGYKGGFVGQDEDEPFDLVTLIPLIISLLVILILLVIVVVVLRKKSSFTSKELNRTSALYKNSNEVAPQDGNHCTAGGADSGTNSRLYCFINEPQTSQGHSSNVRTASLSFGEEESRSQGYCTIDEISNAEAAQGGRCSADDDPGMRKDFQYASVTTKTDGQKETVRYKKSLVNNELYVSHQPGS